MCPINLSSLLGYLRRRTYQSVRRRARVMVSIPVGDGLSSRTLISHTLELGEAGMLIPASSSSLGELNGRGGQELSVTLSLPDRPVTVRATPAGTRSAIENGEKVCALELKITAIGRKELDQLRDFLARVP